MDLRQDLNRPPKRQRIDEEGDAHVQPSPSHHAPPWGQNPPATAAVQSQRHCSIFSNSASITPNATRLLVEEKDAGIVEAQDTTVCFGMVSA